MKFLQVMKGILTIWIAIHGLSAMILFTLFIFAVPGTDFPLSSIRSLVAGIMGYVAVEYKIRKKNEKKQENVQE
ncbi:hypothetical protein CHL76_08450 [Marinococcus halophilus]|uniref:Uncharacterized protein n=1 Tax=Marinococcus halophilus TaxID=1371 RepID=A0A510Y4A7_MARHA|nr:hypothetical protein [Marinococcus halophilus]OZT80128.1 hypothetical protein CHL76_08450 [Marinococcus halophilus]GEK58176.1 hypothetical protein MHA01_10810 [Marinococcus halophilus]